MEHASSGPPPEAGLIGTPSGTRATENDGGNERYERNDCYGELVQKLPAAWQPSATWTDAMRTAREGLIEGMAVWHEVFCAAAKTEDDAPPIFQIAVHEGAKPEYVFRASAHAGSR